MVNIIHHFRKKSMDQCGRLSSNSRIWGLDWNCIWMCGLAHLNPLPYALSFQTLSPPLTCLVLKLVKMKNPFFTFTHAFTMTSPIIFSLPQNLLSAVIAQEDDSNIDMKTQFALECLTPKKGLPSLCLFVFPPYCLSRVSCTISLLLFYLL